MTPTFRILTHHYLQPTFDSPFPKAMQYFIQNSTKQIVRNHAQAKRNLI